MPDENWGDLAETRFNRELKGLDKIKNKEDYQNLLEEYFGQSQAGLALLNAKKRSWHSISSEMYSESKAIDIAEKNQEKEKETIRQQAVAFELSRNRMARLRDEARTAKDTRGISINSVRAWRKNPNRFDLRGIDTKRGKSVRGLNVKRLGTRNLIVRKWVQPVTKTVQYRDVKSGRFIKYKPTRRN